MDINKKIENRTIIGMLENIHLLRHIFIRRSTAESPLHFGQVAIMRMIEQNENCNQNTLAERLSVTPSSVAISTKRLQRSGFITKTVDKDNLRCKRLALTDKGRTAIREHQKIFDEYDKLIFKNFSDEDKAQLFAYLERLISEMQELEGIDKQVNSPMELALLLHRRMDGVICEHSENPRKG